MRHTVITVTLAVQLGLRRVICDIAFLLIVHLAHSNRLRCKAVVSDYDYYCGPTETTAMRSTREEMGRESEGLLLPWEEMVWLKRVFKAGWPVPL